MESYAIKVVILGLAIGCGLVTILIVSDVVFEKLEALTRKARKSIRAFKKK